MLGLDGPSVATLLGSGPIHLYQLATGNAVTVPLAAQKSALLMLESERDAQDSLTVAIQPYSAYRTTSLQAPLVMPHPTLGDVGDRFESRLRRMDASLAGTPASRSYHILDDPRYSVGDTEKFWVISNLSGSNASTETQVTAKAVYVGPHCYVFEDESIPSGQVDSKLQTIGSSFDQKIYPTDTRIFGTPMAAKVNGDDRVTLLVTPAVGDYGQDTIIGYFTARDLYAPTADPKNPLLQHSNQRLMLYISSLVVDKGTESDYLGTCAHEFQHLINASNKLFQSGSSGHTEEVWLDEGLAMYAMAANGYGLDADGGVLMSHVISYQSAPSLFSLTDWDVDPNQSAYGAVYLFITYLVDRFGEGILHELVSSPETGITNMNDRLVSRHTTFNQVFEDWTVANLLDHTGLSSDPKYNYTSLNMIGTYAGQTLHGLKLEPIDVPNAGSLAFLPYSAQYFYVGATNGGSYQFTLKGASGQDFGGVVATP